MDKRDLDRLEELKLLLADVLKKERRRQGKCLCIGTERSKSCTYYDYKNSGCLLL